MPEVLRIRDDRGRDVVLTEDRWAHIRTRHANMADKLDLISTALTSPAAVTRARHIGHGENWYGRGRTIYAKVGVKYRPTPQGWEGEILTAHLADRIDPKEESL